MDVLLSRYWIDHCYNWLHHRHALQALYDPQGDLHRGRTSFSEIQVDLQEPLGITQNYSTCAKIALSSEKIKFVEDRKGCAARLTSSAMLLRI